MKDNTLFPFWIHKSLYKPDSQNSTNLEKGTNKIDIAAKVILMYPKPAPVSKGAKIITMFH